MSPSDFSEAVALIAYGILKMRYPDGLPGASAEDSDEVFRKFISREMPEAGAEKLTPEALVVLFERYYDFERVKMACSGLKVTYSP